MAQFAVPVGSRMILACRDTLAAGLATRFAGLHPVEAGETRVERTGLDPAIRVGEYESSAAVVTPIEGEHIPDLHDLALAAAWRDGAWDIQVTLHPPLSGAQLGIVSANRDWDLAQRIEPFLHAAAGAGRLVTWLWRPMLDGPAIRRDSHLIKDATLRPDGGRDGAPPVMPEPIWTWHKGRCWQFRLGGEAVVNRTARQPRAASRPPRAERRATGAQRAYIVHLRRVTGTDIGAALPASLTLPEASAMIDRLLAATR